MTVKFVTFPVVSAEHQEQVIEHLKSKGYVGTTISEFEHQFDPRDGAHWEFVMPWPELNGTTYITNGFGDPAEKDVVGIGGEIWRAESLEQFTEIVDQALAETGANWVDPSEANGKSLFLAIVTGKEFTTF